MPEGLEGAKVTGTSNTGSIFEFLETENGNYVWTPTDNETIGEVGTDYVLQVMVGGQNYGAISTMNKEYKFKYVFPLIGKDFIKMIFGLSVSVGIVLAIHYIIIPNNWF